MDCFSAWQCFELTSLPFFTFGFNFVPTFYSPHFPFLSFPTARSLTYYQLTPIPALFIFIILLSVLHHALLLCSLLALLLILEQLLTAYLSATHSSTTDERWLHASKEPQNSGKITASSNLHQQQPGSQPTYKQFISPEDQPLGGELNE